MMKNNQNKMPPCLITKQDLIIQFYLPYWATAGTDKTLPYFWLRTMISQSSCNAFFPCFSNQWLPSTKATSFKFYSTVYTYKVLILNACLSAEYWNLFLPLQSWSSENYQISAAWFRRIRVSSRWKHRRESAMEQFCTHSKAENKYGICSKFDFSSVLWNGQSV